MVSEAVIACAVARRRVPVEWSPHAPLAQVQTTESVIDAARADATIVRIHALHHRRGGRPTPDWPSGRCRCLEPSPSGVRKEAALSVHREVKAHV